VSRGHQVDRALRKASARDRKRTPRMKVTGASVFGLQKLLRKKKR
jgi:hypothetical protein